MNLKTDRFALLALIVTGPMTGCDDSDSDSGSSVSGSKSLLDLSAAENQQLCKFHERTYKDSLGSEEQYCTVEALFGVTSAAECEGYKSECFEAGDYADDTEDWECEKATERYFVSDDGDSEVECEATVAEFEACIKADAARWQELTQYSCTQAGEANYPVDLVEECKTLSEKCPDVDL